MLETQQVVIPNDVRNLALDQRPLMILVLLADDFSSESDDLTKISKRKKQ
jgi:hypothetical protein